MTGGSRHNAAMLTAHTKERSREKRQRAIAVIEELSRNGARISAARVSREAAVSTWTIYSVPKVRAAFDRAVADQRTMGIDVSNTVVSTTASGLSLRTDLTMAQAEVKRLRMETGRLKDRLAVRIGDEMENIEYLHLRQQIQDLEVSLSEARADKDKVEADIQGLRNVNLSLEEDVAAAQRNVRALMRDLARAQD